jgi:hypothetical protein
MRKEAELIWNSGTLESKKTKKPEAVKPPAGE